MIEKLIELYMRVHRWIFPLMPSDVAKQCREEFEAEKKKYVYADENMDIHVLSEDDLPKCPKTGGVSPKVWIIGNARETPEVEHINCRCSYVLNDDVKEE